MGNNPSATTTSTTPSVAQHARNSTNNPRNINQVEASTSTRNHSSTNAARTAQSPQHEAVPAVTRTGPYISTSWANNNINNNTTSNMSTADGALGVGMPCLNPASDVNSRLDTQIEVKVYPCNNSNNGNRKKFTQFVVKPEVGCVCTTQFLRD